MVVFNPEHDMCLANGDVNYVPTVSASKFAEQCRWIEKFMVPIKGEEITPWGWNNCLRNKLLRQGVAEDKMPTAGQIDFIATNSRREFALDLHNYIHTELASGEIVCPNYRVAAQTLGDVEEFIAKRGGGVLKAPLSGSGKGIRYVKRNLNSNDSGWVCRVLQKQGAVLVEEQKEIVRECAMLFLCSKEGIQFKGYSLFTSVNGAYRANLLACNQSIEKILSGYISADVLEKVKKCILDFFELKLLGRYVGYIGVDQMCCKDGFVCASEINLRMTMGHIARNIYDLYANEYNLVDGEFSFSPVDGIIRL